jgi:hypothetical protein
MGGWTLHSTAVYYSVFFQLIVMQITCYRIENCYLILSDNMLSFSFLSSFTVLTYNFGRTAEMYIVQCWYILYARTIQWHSTSLKAVAAVCNLSSQSSDLLEMKSQPHLPPPPTSNK